MVQYGVHTYSVHMLFYFYCFIEGYMYVRVYLRHDTSYVI